MNTQNKQGLDLARKVFDHFAPGELQLAREIIDLESLLDAEPEENRQPSQQTETKAEIVFPTSDIAPDELGLTEDAENEQPFDQERTISSEEDNLPF